MELKYKIDDKPKLPHLLLYGLQWWVVILPCLVIMGVVVARMHYGDNLAQQIFYMQRLFGIMGTLTLVQVFWGHRLPLVAGPATVLLVGIVTTLSSGVEIIYTSMLVGGAILAVCAFCGAFSYLRFFFTPRIVASILILIAFTLSPTILQLIGSETHSAARMVFSLVFVVLLIICNTILPGVWKSLTVIIGMAIGSLSYFCLFGFSSIPQLAGENKGTFFLSSLDFNLGVIIAFLFCFFALLVNELGSVESVGHMLQAKHMEKRIKRGTGFIGLANMAAGYLGVIGPVDFSLSAGVIAATGCASRYPFVPAGLGILLCAFFPKLIIVLVAIPSPVMGALLLYLMSTQLASGLMMLLQNKAVNNFSAALTIALPLMVGLIISFAPKEIFTNLSPLLRPIVANGFIMGTVTVILLEHVILKKSNNMREKKQ